MKLSIVIVSLLCIACSLVIVADPLSRRNIKTGHVCKAKEPCIFLGKSLGFETFNDTNNIGKVVRPIISNSWNSSKATIFLSISTYRERLCPNTLFSLYTRATYPSRIFIGLVQQNEVGDIDCVEKYCDLMRNHSKLPYDNGIYSCPYINNIRVMRFNASAAKGPTWARALGTTMLRDEEFCMQTDSHMEFVPGWDVGMLSMWALTGNEYGILSTYGAATDTLEANLPGRRGTNNRFETPHLCMITFSGAYGMVRNWGTKSVFNLPRPKLTNMLWGAGLSFSKCHAERKAAYDPHTPFIFDGEEFSRALRFWTWGYDIYTPHRVYSVHLYLESQADPIHNTWSDNMNSDTIHRGDVLNSVQRLKMIMNMPNIKVSPLKILELQQSKYGLGDRRTIDQAIQFSGIDFKKLKILGNYCGNLDYIPFIEHPWGADYIPKYDNITERFIDVRDPGSIYFNATTMTSTWEVAHNKWLEKRKADHQRQQHQHDDDQLITSSSTSSTSISSSLHDHLSRKSIAHAHSSWIIEHKLLINLVVLTGILLMIVVRIGFYWQSVYSYRRDSKHRSVTENQVDNSILKAA